MDDAKSDNQESGYPYLKTFLSIFTTLGLHMTTVRHKYERAINIKVESNDDIELARENLSKTGEACCRDVAALVGFENCTARFLRMAAIAESAMSYKGT